MIEYGHFIGGKRVPGKSGKSADVFQPMDGSVRAKVALASKAEVRAAVAVNPDSTIIPVTRSNGILTAAVLLVV